MVLVKKIFLVCVIILIIICSIDAFTSSIPFSDGNTTGNDTTNSRLFNNNKVSVSVSSGCFSSETLVTLANQQQIPIVKLRPGDQLLTIGGTQIVTTEMMMMLDQNKLSSAIFHTILTASGHKVSLTGLHLMGTIINNEANVRYIAAKDIECGDLLRVVSNGQVYASPVINVTTEVKSGFYAPLTMTGTLLVNNIDASCFSNVRNHDMAQFYMAPFRWYYQISRSLSIEKPFGDQTKDEIHYVPRILFEIVKSIYPSNLRLV